jgi:hypothetical protein
MQHKKLPVENTGKNLGKKQVLSSWPSGASDEYKIVKIPKKVPSSLHGPKTGSIYVGLSSLRYVRFTDRFAEFLGKKLQKTG